MSKVLNRRSFWFLRRVNLGFLDDVLEDDFDRAQSVTYLPRVRLKVLLMGWSFWEGFFKRGVQRVSGLLGPARAIDTILVLAHKNDLSAKSNWYARHNH